MATVTGDQNIESKTDSEEELQEFTTTRDKPKGVIGRNVLNSYRSYTYNFTIAGWPTDQTGEEEDDPLYNTVILSSAGKGRKTFFPKGLDETGETIVFNENSAGRFDLYIDNIELETIPTPGSRNGNTIATSIKFDVFEPYSVVGFLEALRASAKYNGFKNYLDAYYLFRLDFKGYNDGDDLPAPTDIGETRIFKIKFTAVDVDVDLTGTKYRCSAIPFDEWGLSDVLGSLKFPLKMKGETVGDIAKDLVTNLNESILKEAQKVDSNITADQVDQYDIWFVDPEKDRFIEKNGSNIEQSNEIGEASVKEIAVNNAIYNFENVTETKRRTAYQQEGNATEFAVYEPDKLAVSFAEGSFIHEILSTLARDSTFWTDQVNPESGKITDDVFKFWRIIPELTVGKYSPFHKRETYKVLYKVVVQKMHISMLPPNQGNSYDPSKLTILRRYDYFYTGKNTDILNLKIKFDKLFYERVTVGLGNNDVPTAKNSDKPAGSQDNKADKRTLTDKIPGADAAPIGPPSTETAIRNAVPAQGAANAVSPATAKSYLAKDYYDILLSDSVSMIEVEVEIIGDPIWIAQGDGTLDEDSKNSFSYYVKLYFRNPVDVDELELNQGGTGLLKFSNKNIQFSGIFMVRQIVSSFRGGVFKQTLKMSRLPFVDDDDPESTTLVQGGFGTKPNENDQSQPSTNTPVPLDQRSTLKNLVSDVNRFADNLQNVEQRINGAIQGAATGLTEAIGQVAAVPNQAIAKVVNKIQGKLQQIDNAAVDAANTLGLTPTQLGSLTPSQLLATIGISKLLTSNLNFQQLEKNGVILPSKDAILTVPPTENTENLSNIVTQSVADVQQNYENLMEQLPTEVDTTIRNSLQG